MRDTVEEALDMLEDAIEVHLEDLADLGNLDRVFRERGIIVRDDVPDKGKEVLVSALPGKIYRAYAMKIPALAVG